MLFNLILKTILRKEVTVMAVIYATLIIKGTLFGSGISLEYIKRSDYKGLRRQ